MITWVCSPIITFEGWNIEIREWSGKRLAAKGESFSEFERFLLGLLEVVPYVELFSLFVANFWGEDGSYIPP